MSKRVATGTEECNGDESHSALEPGTGHPGLTGLAPSRGTGPSGRTACESVANRELAPRKFGTALHGASSSSGGQARAPSTVGPQPRWKSYADEDTAWSRDWVGSGGGARARAPGREEHDSSCVRAGPLAARGEARLLEVCPRKKDSEGPPLGNARDGRLSSHRTGPPGPLGCGAPVPRRRPARVVSSSPMQVRSQASRALPVRARAPQARASRVDATRGLACCAPRSLSGALGAAPEEPAPFPAPAPAARRPCAALEARALRAFLPS
ncbi:hypothetical protein ACSSS7_004971 [Eimeria intestinalis]